MLSTFQYELNESNDYLLLDGIDKTYLEAQTRPKVEVLWLQTI